MFEKLKYIDPLMDETISCGNIAGASLAVIYKGETVYKKHFGMADKEKGVKMSDETVFRLFSLSKPITAAAAMILMERGKYELRYPVKWFLPTFENPMVLDEKGLRPAERDITIADLLNMTSGVAYPAGTPAGMKVGELWGGETHAYENGLKQKSTMEFILEQGKCPLEFSPGERWMYGASADVMGALIEAVSGMKFSEFLKKEIFEPLEMPDTGFYLSKEKYHRLAQVYDHKPEGNLPFKEHSLCTTDYDAPPAFESGGAGMVSTIEDYSHFVKMLLGKGSYKGRNIIGRKTAEFMASDCLTEKQRAYADWDSMKGHGYGNFMRVLINKSDAGSNGSLGEFGWDGWLGCYFCADPAEDMAMLYFIQQTNSGCTDHVRKLQHIIWGAVE